MASTAVGPVEQASVDELHSVLTWPVGTTSGSPENTEGKERDLLASPKV